MRSTSQSTTIDLTLDSSPEPDLPPHSKATSSEKLSKGKGRAADIVIDDDDDDDEQEQENGDAALAKLLQEQMDAEYQQEQNEAPIATTSNKRNPNPPSRRNDTFQSSSNEKREVQSDEFDPKTILYQHRKLFLSQGKCTCGSTLSPEDKPKLEPDSDGSPFLTTGSASCKQCSKTLCRGCWEAKAIGTECCAAQRAIILFEVLSALDKAYLVDHLKKPSTSASEAKPKKRGKPSGKGAGTGYGSGQQAYSGYNGVNGTLVYGLNGAQSLYQGDEDAEDEDYDEEDYYTMNRQAQAKPLQSAKFENTREQTQDKLYLSALKLISSLLPHPNSPTASIYDYLPHSTLSALLEVSTLPDLLANLLLNDSVTEWQKRSQVYFAMLDVLQGLGQSEVMLKVLFGEMREKKWSEGLGNWLRGEGDVVWERKEVPLNTTPGKGRGKKRKMEEDEDEKEEGEILCSTPLFSYLKKLTIQADAFRKAALSGEFDEGDAALIGICGDFVAAGERCAGLATVWNEVQGREGKGEGKDGGKAVAREGQGEAVEKEWTDGDYLNACATLSYKSVELEVGDPAGGKSFLTHHYKRDIDSTSSSRRGHQGFVHLAKELAVLSTSLPSGIWLRVDETRIDVMKCLIAGPEGTPYSGGLFEFDIFIPLQYPQVSPQVWLKTTGGGRVRFNPNLYAEGKVCLSLLGTWPGSPEEMWQPNASTILQVLISISSMILCAFPFYNEPSMGVPKDDVRNKHYNMNTSLATVRYGMIEWMSDEKKDSIWSEVIYSHFMLRRNQTTPTVLAWSAKDDRMKKWDPKHNALAGSHHLQGYVGANLGVGGYGRTLNSAAEVATPGGRDLVQELEDAFERLKTWKEETWLEEIIEK